MAKDLLGIVEASYRVDSDDATWLGGVVDAARPLLDRGCGVMSILYDASDAANLQILSQAFRGTPLPLENVPERHVQKFDRGFVEATFLSQTCTLASRSRPRRHRAMAQAMTEMYRPLGIHDVLIVNGVDPSGNGCFLGGLLPKRGRLSPAQAQTWSRVAAHVAAGNRLRQRLADSRRGEPPDAVVAPDGRVVHAESPAKSSEAREALKRAAARQERSRGKLRRSDPEAAIAGWKGLIAARWTLVDQFESDGRRYLLARQNEPNVHPLASLTHRERCAAGYAALGHTNKLIAYEMGIAPSTVSVLLHRVAQRLGTKTRAALIAAFLNGAREGR